MDNNNLPEKSSSKSRKPLVTVILVIAVLIMLEVWFIFIRKPQDKSVPTTAGTAVAETSGAVAGSQGAVFVTEEALTESETDSPEMNQPEAGMLLTKTLPENVEMVDMLGIKDLDLYLSCRKNDTDKICRIPLSDAAQEGDIIESVSLKIRTTDGSTPLGMIKFGTGISLTENIPSATSDLWYSWDDQGVTTEECEYTLEVVLPDEIKNYIDISEGCFMFGYWWGDNEEIILTEAEFHTKTPRLIADSNN